jgi:eukaryotic-like serine/threonine-protein kinase
MPTPPIPDPGSWPTRPMDATPVATQQTLPGSDVPERLGPYKLMKPLGQGGMGVVFLAEDTQLGRRAAVKVMRSEVASYDPRSYERFVREARAAAAVRHDNVVTVYQVGEENGVPYLAMELLRGTTLSAYLNKGPLPTIVSAARLGREIADGLAAAHAKGLVHRDIKPGNIWLEAPNGRVKLLDFGLARPTDPDVSGPDRLTGSGLVVGTPGYMSPEQARGEALDERTDLFSLGVVLYLLCTGKEPFAGVNAMAVLTALAVDIPAPANEVNPKVPEALSGLIDRLLEKKPADRPQSAREVAQTLRQIERGQLPAVSAPAAPLPTAEAEAQTYAMGQATQPAGAPNVPTERPKPRRSGARRKRRKPVRVAWLIAAFSGLVPVLIGATWLIAREHRPTETKTPAVQTPVTQTPTSTPAASQTTTPVEPPTAPGEPPADNPPVGHLPPPPKMGFGPPAFGPGSPGYGPPHGPPGGPRLPFPPPKKD